MAAPAAAATSGPPGDVPSASSGATEKKGMAEDGVTYTRYAGEADNRGASMVAKHHEIMQARKEKADLERLSRLVPDLCEPVLVIALQENNYDVPDAQGLLRDFRHDCQERLAQLQRKRKRVRQGRVDLSKPKPEAKGAGTAEKADDGSGSGSDSESGSGSDSGSDSDSDEEEGVRGRKDRAEVERKTGENGETEAGRREATLDQPVEEAIGRRGRGEGSEASDDDRSREKEARPSRGGGDAEAEAAREGKSGSERSREEKEREKERGRKKRREREKERSKRRGKEWEQERAGRRRRKAKEKEREKERERKKRRKDKESKAKGGKSETETAAEILGRFGVIRETDYGAKKPEFIQWALEVRKQDTELMSRFEERAMFMEYLQDYNTQKLPHEKYYNLEAWEKKRHLKAMQRAAEGKTGADPADELPMFDDEKVRQRELREQRIKEAQERMAAAYDELRTSGKAQEMREQEMLRMQMNLHYRTGNVEQARELQERLGPDDSNPYKKKHASIRELR